MVVLTIEPEKNLRGLDINLRKIHEDKDTSLLHEFYDIIGCRSIDIVDFPLDGNHYSIVCDDEFMCRDPLVPSFIVSEDIVLFGAVVFTRTDDDGNTIGLEPEDITKLYAIIRMQFPFIQKMIQGMYGRNYERETNGAVLEAMKIINNLS